MNTALAYGFDRLGEQSYLLHTFTNVPVHESTFRIHEIEFIV
jgi:hypothetical protein